MDVHDSLVDSHLVSVPSVGTLSAWRLSSGHSQDLGGHSNRASGVVALVLGPSNDLIASVLERLDMSTLEGDTKRTE